MLGAGFPGQSATRRPAVAIRPDQAVRKARSSRVNRSYRREARRDIEIREVAVFLRKRRIIFVAQAEHDGQVRIHAPIVVGVSVPGILAEIRAVPSELNRTGLRQSQQKVREIQTGIGNRLAAGIERAGGDAAERERAACILVGGCVAVLPLEVPAERHGVILLHPHVGIAFRDILHHRHAMECASVRLAKLVKAEGGRSVVDRLLRSSLDAQVGRYIRSIREEGILRGAIAIEGHLRGVDAVRADVVGPTQIRVVAKTSAGIQKSEQLRGVALAALETFSSAPAGRSCRGSGSRRS